jgi:nucleoside-diphosphate kinase
MIKPDAVGRGLEGTIIERIERTGLTVEASREVRLSSEEASNLYSCHQGKPFYAGLIRFITSGPVVVMRVSGENAIKQLRGLMGDTDPLAAERGTIRGDLREAVVLTEDGIIKNLIHGSDSPESAARELAIFFND